MDATTLREAIHTHLPREAMKAHAELVGVQKRARKLDLYALVVTLMMTAGSDDSDRHADVREAFQDEADQQVARSSFYAWFSDMLMELLRQLLLDATEAAWERPPLLAGELATMG